MTDVGPGDFVECIVAGNEDDPAIMAHWLCGARIDVGSVYQVMRVERGIDNFGEETFGFVLVERDTHWPRGSDGELGAWSHYHFRPLQRPAESTLIEDLMARATEPATEPA
jgi:hypothetical protein